MNKRPAAAAKPLTPMSEACQRRFALRSLGSTMQAALLEDMAMITRRRLDGQRPDIRGENTSLAFRWAAPRRRPRSIPLTSITVGAW
jgi:hypothetical protein